MRRFSLIGILTFLGLFVYFYKTSGKFRKSIMSALVAAFVLASGPLESEAKGADAFTPQQQTTHSQRNRNRFSRTAKKPNNNGPGKPNGSDGGGDDGDDNNGMPRYPKVESVEETQNRVYSMDEYLARMEESSDSESEQCEAEKTNVEVGIVKDEIILRATRGNWSVLIDESTARKKIYHAPDFGVKLPDILDLEYAKSLSTKARFQYLSDPNVLPQKCVGEFMKKLSEHVIDPNTDIKAGTLGKNGKTKGWGEPTPGMHAFNSNTGNDVFFADKGDQDFTFHTGMNLNDDQIDDLEDNDNIL